MKKIIITLIIIKFSWAALAHTIKGTMVLKGSLKTNILIKNKITSCRIRILKVKNLLDEDSYGNPAYNVKASIHIDSVNFDKEVWVNNLFVLNTDKTEVRDFEYHSEDESSKIFIDEQGRVKTVLIRYQGKNISCSF